MGVDSVAGAARLRRYLAATLIASTFLGLGLVCTERPLTGPAHGPGPPNESPTSTSTPHVRTIVAYSMEAEFLPPSPPVLRCRGLRPPPPSRILWDKGMWQKPQRTPLFLFSAYYDARLRLQEHTRHFVRVIAMSEGELNGAIYCQLWYDGEDEPLVVEAIKTEIWIQEWGRAWSEGAYKPVLLSCPVPPERSRDGPLPRSASLTSAPCLPASTLLSVGSDGYPGELLRRRRRPRVAVCVKGMDFAEDRSARLVEWLELNLLLGAGRFFVYVYSVHRNMSRVLGYYAERGVLEALPLTLPGRQTDSPPSARSLFLRENLWQKRRNELVPYNDCFYRNLYRFEYVLPIDVDEVILPVKSRTWAAMLEELSSKDPSILERHASFSVRNAYFFDGFPVEKGGGSAPPHLHMLRHLVRSANFSRPGESVKSFVSTGNALTVFNHYALHPLHPAMKKDFLIGSDLAQMNHYKSECSPIMFPDCYTNFLYFKRKDPLILKYRSELTKRVEKVLGELRLI